MRYASHLLGLLSSLDAQLKMSRHQNHAWKDWISAAMVASVENAAYPLSAQPPS